MAEFVSSVNGKDLFAKRAERTRSGIVIETYNDGASDVPGILPAGLLPGNEGTDEANTLATQQYVLDQVGSVAEAMLYKGAVNSDSDLPDGSTGETQYKAGWTYKVATAGTYAGKVCEVGDLIIANKDYASGATASADWDVIQTNIDGAVIGPQSAVNENIAVFDGTTGKQIKNGAAIVTEVSGSSTNAQVPTAAAVNTAITGAVSALDATVTGAAASKTLATLTETDGVIAATFQDIQIAESQVTDLETDLGAKANKSELTITDVSGDSTKKTIQLKSGTSQDVLVAHQNIDGKADKAVPTAAGNFAGLDSNGNLTDSGKKAADFATAAQGTKADSAIQGVEVNGTALVPGSNKVVDIPAAAVVVNANNAYGVVTLGVVDL